MDCGAYDGDTIRDFLDVATEGFRKIIAFEPDPASFRKVSHLVSTLECKDLIELHEAATGAENGVVQFTGDGTAAASVGSGPMSVKCVITGRALAALSPRT